MSRLAALAKLAGGLARVAKGLVDPFSDLAEKIRAKRRANIQKRIEAERELQHKLNLRYIEKMKELEAAKKDKNGPTS